MKNQFRLTFAALFIALVPASLWGQAEYYLKFDKGSGAATPVGGSVAAKGFEEQVEVLSFAFNGANSTTIGSATGSGAGNAFFQPLEFLIEMDTKAFPNLLKNLTLGGHFDQVILTGVRQNGVGAADTFLQMTFHFVIVSEISLEGVQGDRGVFSLILDWGAMETKTFSVNPQTGESEESGSVQWSRVNNDSSINVDP